MKDGHEYISIGTLCKWFGISRQAYYQHEWKVAEEALQYDLVLSEIKAIRQRHPKLGTRKLQEMLYPFMQEYSVKMGRDALFNLLAVHGMLIRARKRNVRTTNSNHWLKKYPNLIIDFTPSKPNELWVSDITYWKIQDSILYLHLITDAFSRKIVGYQVSETLLGCETIKALKMALRELSSSFQSHFQLIHHSDRGSQYCANLYVNLLKKKQIKISMTQNGDPLENAVAERVNGIIKEEYLLNYQCNNMKDANKKLSMAVWLYNTERPHSSIGNLTPEFVHTKYHQISMEKIKKLWKNYYTKKTIFVNAFQD
jgi:transposase InsO family protein